jgi:hypothetical protein
MKRPPPPPILLSGRRLVIAQAVWVILALLALALFAAGLPLLYDEVRTLSISDTVDRAEVRANLAQLGLSLSFYAGYYVALAVALAAACFALAAVIFRRRSNEPIALFVALALVLLGATFSGANEALVGAVYPSLKWLSNFLELLSSASIFLFFYIFPDGRFVPHWTRWPAMLLITGVVFMSFFPNSAFNLDNWPDSLYAPVLLGWLLAGLLAQTYRYRRVSGPPERQQTKWVVFGFVAALAGFLGLISIDLFFPSLQPGTLADFVITAAIHWFMLLIPLSLAIAILRYRLWDIDLIINRTVVYGTLTVTLGLVYYIGVMLLQAPLRSLAGQESPLAVVVSTLAVAGLFMPLRRRIQSFIDRRFYRSKYDARKTLEAFSAKLRDETDLDALSSDLAAVVRETMQPAHVSLWLRPDHIRDGSRDDRRVADGGDGYRADTAQ